MKAPYETIWLLQWKYRLQKCTSTTKLMNWRRHGVPSSTGCKYVQQRLHKSILISLKINWILKYPIFSFEGHNSWSAILLTAIANLYAKQFPIMTAMSWLLHYLRVPLHSTVLVRSLWFLDLNGNFTIHYFYRNW